MLRQSLRAMGGGFTLAIMSICMNSSYFHEKEPKETSHSRISSVGRVLNCRAGGRGFDSRDRINTQGLKMTEK